jgi:zinc protease
MPATVARQQCINPSCIKPEVAGRLPQPLRHTLTRHAMTHRKSSKLRLFTRLRALSVWTVVALFTSATALMAQKADLEKVLHRKVLPNGLEVIVLVNSAVPLATIEFDVRNGSFTQSAEYAGLAHMYEHMFFKSNRYFPDPDEFIHRATDLGAIFNGTTSEERVNYYMTLPASNFDQGIDLMSAAIRYPNFRRDELERERQVVIGEYDRQESNPFFRLTQKVEERLWKGNVSRKNVIGDRQVILTTTPEKMRLIQMRYYNPNNTALIVTGDVNPAEVFASAERHLGTWARSPDPFAADPIPKMAPLAGNESVIVEEPVSGDVIMVYMQWHGPSVGADPNATYAADVFSDIVNNPGSRFHSRLIDSGLFQSCSINYYTLNNVGPITIAGETTRGKLREALKALDEEISRFADTTYYTHEEMEAVKAKRAVESAFGLERASALAQTIGFWWSVASLDYFMSYVEEMARQTPSDLRRYTNTYIAGRPRVTGVLISPESRRALNLTEQELLTWKSGR